MAKIASKTLTVKEKERLQLTRPDCRLIDARVRSLSDYLAVFNSLPRDGGRYWYRGHEDIGWELCPSALRFKTAEERTKAIRLISEFRRTAEIKLLNPPGNEDDLKWVQVARHYGLPTRLLDWTENAAIALYFACQNLETDGAVFLLNPTDLNRNVDAKKARILNAVDDDKLIRKYLALDGTLRKKGLKTIAVEPVWNSERIMLQRGVFTLHGRIRFALDVSQATSLVFLPIMRDEKATLLCDLQSIGIDEMSIFPEPEHVCRHLTRIAGLDR